MLKQATQGAQQTPAAQLYLPFRFRVEVQELDAEARVANYKYEVHAYTSGAEAYFFKDVKTGPGGIFTEEEKVHIGSFSVKNGAPSFSDISPEHRGRIIQVFRDAYEQSKRTPEHGNPRHTPISHIRTALGQVFEVASVKDLIARLS